MDEQPVEPDVIPGLTEGRMVHFVLGGESRHPGEHRPAMIVKVWNHAEPGTSNLCVFVDGENDFPRRIAADDGALLASMTQWQTSINHSEEKEMGTWHWIEKA